MDILKGQAAILRACNSIKRRGASLDKDIQIAAVSIIAHVAEHRDATVVSNLLDAMPKGSRVNALREYLETFGNLTWDMTDKVMKLDKDKTADIDGAIAIMWTEFKPEPEYKPLDVVGTLSRLINKAKKRVEKGEITEAEIQLLESVKNRFDPEAETDTVPVLIEE